MEKFVSFRRLQLYHNNVKETLKGVVDLTNLVLEDFDEEKQDKLSEALLANINMDHVTLEDTSDTTNYADVF